MQILQDPTSEPLLACDSQPSDRSRLEWRKTQAAFALKPKDTAVELSVQTSESGAVDVIKDMLGLRFTDGSGITAPNRACWGGMDHSRLTFLTAQSGAAGQQLRNKLSSGGSARPAQTQSNSKHRSLRALSRSRFLTLQRTGLSSLALTDHRGPTEHEGAAQGAP